MRLFVIRHPKRADGTDWDETRPAHDIERIIESPGDGTAVHFEHMWLRHTAEKIYGKDALRAVFLDTIICNEDDDEYSYRSYEMIESENYRPRPARPA
ncbi:hypothetical protein [Corynebacterium lubricantis]|uniref:hypothetical protein n=1 Tax=Corynebacterium lubricantis TaxID=541095 RepID=UPI0012EA670D|nr:hypothetical protein [Corynebacterium lubricantis]